MQIFSLFIIIYTFEIYYIVSLIYFNIQPSEAYS